MGRQQQQVPSTGGVSHEHTVTQLLKDSRNSFCTKNDVSLKEVQLRETQYSKNIASDQEFRLQQDTSYMLICHIA